MPTAISDPKQQYWSNAATDNVKYWTISFVATAGTGFGNYTSPTTYGAGQLYKRVTENEQNRQVIEFKDKEGHTVLKKVQLSGTDAGSGSAHSGWLCIYYLYDDLGNLRCVVQPEGVKQLEANGWNFTANILKEQCFRYEYDSRNRMIIKQVPGAGPVYMVYDARDRLVMTQGSVMRTSHKWLTTHYDDLNRADTTWLYTTASSTTFSSLLAAAAASQKYPTATPSASTFLTETHYDNYTGISVPTKMSTTYKVDWNTYLLPASTTSFPYAEEPKQNSSITTKGLVTWSRVRVLDSTLQLVTINIYDDKGRVIQTQSENITGGIDVTTTQYSWAGWPLVTIQRQQEKKGTVTQTTVVVTKMTYDDLGRLVRTEMKQSNSSINSGAMSAYATISEIGYDALGQVESKKIGKRRSSASSYTTTPLETEDYDYNIRGWLLGVNRDYVRDAGTTSTTATATTTAVTSGEMFTESSMDLQTVTFPSKNFFGFDLGYDKRDNDRINDILYDSARYDGNITGMTWKGDNDRKIRKYDFSYDPVSRLTEARFGQLTGMAFSNATVKYDVKNLTYDGNGNILSLYRYGLKPSGSSTVIDQLSYTYKTGSNKLARVADQAASTAADHLGDFQDGTNSGDDYAYDGNGNMTSDQNKKITAISYNVLNLPSVITVAGKGLIKYYYDAAGNKLQKRTTDISAGPSKTTVTTYIGGAVYQNDTLQFFGTPEGRVRANTARTAWIYDYFLKDHLGNTRMMITDDYNVSSPILEAYSYYPFGLQQKGIGLTANSSLHNYKNTFQKQELNEDLGVGLYEFKYRMDDPQIGRFWQVDPLADKYVYNSTYAFSENKVTGAIELEGLEILPVNSAWFRMTAEQKSNQVWKLNVSVVTSNVPTVFKDKTGSPLFSAGSVDVNASGYIGGGSGEHLRPGNDLPANPSWSWSTGTPEPPNSVAGGRMGLDLTRNRIFADKAGAIAGAAEEGFKWYDTFHNKVPKWDAYGDLIKNQMSFDKAVNLANKYKSEGFKAGVVNFLNDGTLPRFNFSKLSIQSGINIMEEGMSILKQNNLPIRSETLETYELYRKLFQIIENLNKRNHSEQ